MNEWIQSSPLAGTQSLKSSRTMSMWLHSQLVSDLGRQSVKILVTFLHLSKLRPIQETQTACKCGLYTKGSVCVCVFFSILPTGCQHFLAFWLHLQQRQSEISFTLNMKTTIDLSSMHQPVIYYTRAMYSARIKGPSAFPWQSFLFFPRFIMHLLTQLFLNLAGKVSVGE